MNLYHALNRGVDKRDIFLDSQDYARFVHDMYEFNDARPAGNAYRNFNPQTMMDLRSPSFGTNTNKVQKRERIVDIHGWCLMKNHYHLLLSERVEGGISMFLRKLNVGYVKYFNERYERTGTLLQGRTKKILIDSDAHFLYILSYIHLNPLDYLSSAHNWRIRDKGAFRSAKRALEYLKEYRWSSYLDYCGEKNFPSVITTDLFADASSKYEETIASYLRDTEKDTIKALSLE